MKYATTGFILYVVEYDACVHFYESLLELPVLYKKPGLVCFEFGGSYLMVEEDDREGATSRTEEEPRRTCLRLNVDDINTARLSLERHGLEFTFGQFAWGSVIKFYDPAGNLVAFRSNAEHEEDTSTWAANNN